MQFRTGLGRLWFFVGVFGFCGLFVVGLVWFGVFLQDLDSISALCKVILRESTGHLGLSDRWHPPAFLLKLAHNL